MILTYRICYSKKFQQDVRRIKNFYKEYESNIKYKTEMCKNWILGQCKFSESCIFAHGSEELKVNLVPKSKLCKNFDANHCCLYGEKCQFLHKHSLKKRLPVFATILLRGITES